MALGEDRTLSAGDVLVAQHKGAEHRAVVVSAEPLRLMVDGVLEASSVSKAGTLVTGGSVNGWEFWSREGEVPLSKVKAAVRQAVGPKAAGGGAARPSAVVAARAVHITLLRAELQTPVDPDFCAKCARLVASKDGQCRNCDELVGQERGTAYLCTTCGVFYDLSGEWPAECSNGHRDSSLPEPVSEVVSA